MGAAAICLEMVARGGSVRDKPAMPVWTPKAPRRGDERSEESTESMERRLRQLALRASVAAARLG